MNLYIIIVTYNAMPWISKCLKSIKPFSAIVVDNSSTDETVNFIQENYPDIMMFQQSENLGFGQANNIGISYALKKGAEYVFLLNQDAYLESNTVKGLIEVYKKNTDVGILSPIHLNGDGTKLDFNFSNYIAVNKELQYDAIKQSFLKEIYEIPFVNAAGWLLPKETLKKVGGFDPIFFHYAEDDNYCQRVIYHGLKIGVCPNYFLLHDRENRKTKDVNTVNEKLKNKERSLKYGWANINIDPTNQILKLKKSNLKIILKLLIRLNFKALKYYIKEYRLVKKILPEINRSRNINRTSGSHYLNNS